MNKEQKKKYPKAIIGAFIFNEKNELLLLKQGNWKNKYTCPGGKVELGETLEEALIREVKEETNLDIDDIRMFEVVDGLNLGDKYRPGDDHFIFIDYIVKAKDPEKLKINRESVKAVWLEPGEWLKRKKDLPHKYIIEAIEKIKREDARNYEDLYKRALADYQNLLKRTTDEKNNFMKYANEQLLYDIIPVYDNLKISFVHIDESAKDNGWAEGLKYVIKQFKDVLSSIGIEEIKTKGEKFDPHIMEAIEGKGRKVKKEVKPGYKLNGKLLVPAKVMLE
ncbi:nucleotide exchange factor GrpE [Candidatus Falkowbacteria bacterium]|nr:MAG: nucleotide exchange factor GrpE [Candidatus Falkowbacteria bacterium]